MFLPHNTTDNTSLSFVEHLYSYISTFSYSEEAGLSLSYRVEIYNKSTEDI